MSTVNVQLVPDDGTCQILDDGERCAKQSYGARLKGRYPPTRTVFVVQLCSDHAAQIAGQLQPEQVLMGDEGHA